MSGFAIEARHPARDVGRDFPRDRAEAPGDPSPELDHALGSPSDICLPACHIIDSFDYTVLLGGGDMDTAKVLVTVTCGCGNGVRW